MFSTRMRKIKFAQPVTETGTALARAERRMPAPSPSTVHPLAHLLHGYVFLHELSSVGVHAARQVAESFSDAVTRPDLRLFHGSLADTHAYFKDMHHLHETISRARSASSSTAPALPPPLVVIAVNALQGFVYGHTLLRTQAPAHIVIADARNLSFRTLREAIGWDDWLASLQAYVALLTYKTSEHAQLTARLRSFVQHMRHMRFRSPARVPTGLGSDDLTRRFGPDVVQLWNAWTHPMLPAATRAAPASSPAHALPPLRSVNTALSPLDFVTRMHDTAAFKDRVNLTVALAEDAMKETFYTAVESLARHNAPGLRYGLRDFELSFLFNDGMRLKRHVELFSPVFGRGKESDLVLSNVACKLPTRPFEMPSARDASIVVTVHTLEGLTLTPARLAFEESRPEELFSSARAAAEVRKAQRVLALKGGTRTHAYGLAPHTGVETCYVEHPLRPGPDAGSPARPGEDFTLFQHLFQDRPATRLRHPRTLALGALFGPAEWKHLHIFFSEKIDDEDFFVVQVPHKRLALWMKSPARLRGTPWPERSVTVLGVFDSDFRLRT